jgi:hypothetical protein
VRDGDRGAAPHGDLQRGLHRAFALGVERRGGLVEQQQRRVLQHRARDGHPLALAAGQAQAALADFGAVAVGQARTNSSTKAARAAASASSSVASAGRSGCSPAPMPEKITGFLRHHRDAPAQVGQAQPAHVDAVDAQAPSSMS